jgi:hypothetical protein
MAPRVDGRGIFSTTQEGIALFSRRRIVVPETGFLKLPGTVHCRQCGRSQMDVPDCPPVALTEYLYRESKNTPGFSAWKLLITAAFGHR